MLRLFPFFLLLFLWCSPAQAAPLAGARHAGPGRTEASSALFSVTLTRAGESAAAEDALVGEFVSVRGSIQPEPIHIGQAADLFVVHQHAGGLALLDASGILKPWNGIFADLEPAQRAVQLTERIELPIFTGRLGASGTHRLYLGYRPPDGHLRYTPLPQRFEVADTSPLAAARALYSAAIAPDILPLCLRCHYVGGLAPTAAHVFAGQDNPDHLEFNLAQFRLLLRPPRGRDHVLSKVQGGRTHGGDVVVPANGDDFLALERFLILLEAAGE